jgi:hypothetical protein
MKTESQQPVTTKKQRILQLWRANHRDLWAIAEELKTTPSYIASVLQEANLISGYYDLYTEPASPINIYSNEFRGRLRFKTIKAARHSLDLIQRAYSRFDALHDRAGQHHCLVTALTICNRAYHSGKSEESEVFRQWLLERLTERKTFEAAKH